MDALFSWNKCNKVQAINEINNNNDAPRTSK